MLKEIAIADAYGAGFEFSPAEKVASKNHLSAFQKHELHDIKGKYTDDTQLTIAVCEALLENPEPTKFDFAKKILDCFKRDPRHGYSKGFYDILTASTTATDLIGKLNTASERNGAAIRSVPIGYLASTEKVTRIAAEQASLTHNTSLGISSSTTVSLIAHYAIHKEIGVHDIPRTLKKHNLDRWDLNWTTEVSVNAHDTVSAALTCLINSRSMSELLINCVNLCGDTDSVAAISVGLASCFKEYKKDLPTILAESLDEPIYGISFLDKLEAALDKQYRQPTRTQPHHPAK